MVERSGAERSDEPVIDETSADEVSADEAPAEEVSADESTADEVPADDAPVEEPPTDEASAADASADEAPVEEPPADEAPAGEPATDEAPAGEPATDEAQPDESAGVPGMFAVPVAASEMPDIPPMEQSDDDAEAMLALKNLEKRRRDRRRKRIIKIGIAAAVAVVAIYAFASLGAQPKKDDSNKQAAPTVAYATRGNFETTVEGTGALNPYDIVIVTPEVEGVVESVSVKPDQEVHKGDVLFTLKSDDLDKAVNEAQIELDYAADAVSDAQEAVGDAKDAKAKAKSESKEEAKRAKSAAKKAKENAEKTLSGPEADLEKAKADADAAAKALDAAEAALEAAKKELIDLERDDPTNVEAINRARKKVEEARNVYDFALLDDKTAQGELTRAQSAYDKAYADVAASVQGSTSGSGATSKYSDSTYDAAVKEARSGVKNAEKGYDKAQTAYDEAVTERDKRVITAPKDGTLVAFDVRVGQSFGASAAKSGPEGSNAGSVQIADLSKMKLTIDVNESEVNDIRVGQQVRCTFPALPGVALTGKVTSVASTATTTESSEGSWSGDGVVTFAVEVLIARPDPQLRLGMSANVSIITNSVPNAIVVPAAAITDSGNTATVEVVTDEATMATETREVKLGSKNTSEAVVESGLAEGEAVLVPDAMASLGSSGGAAGGEVNASAK